MLYMAETLKENPRMAHNLANEIIPLFQEAKERQVYKLLYPFISNGCYKQANFLTRDYILKPLIADNFNLFKGANQYSMFLMSYGRRFYESGTDPRDLKRLREDKRSRMETQDPEESKGQYTNRYEDDPFNFSPFQQFRGLIKREHMEFINTTQDYEVLTFLLYTFILNSARDI